MGDGTKIALVGFVVVVVLVVCMIGSDHERGSANTPPPPDQVYVENQLSNFNSRFQVATAAIQKCVDLAQFHCVTGRAREEGDAVQAAIQQAWARPWEDTKDRDRLLANLREKHDWYLKVLATQ